MCIELMLLMITTKYSKVEYNAYQTNKSDLKTQSTLKNNLAVLSNDDKVSNFIH